MKNDYIKIIDIKLNMMFIKRQSDTISCSIIVI